jgi:hypothetical protein
MAAGRHAVAQPVLDWLDRTGLEDVRIEALADQLTGAS